MQETCGVFFNKVTFSHGAQNVLREVSFHAPLGAITVLMGPSGSGKTTCLRLVAGLEAPQQGEIHLFEQCTSTAKKVVEPHHRCVGYCFQDDALWPAVSAEDHLSLPLKNWALEESEKKNRIEETLESFSLTDCRKRLPHQLSGGEQKRLAFARSVVTQPRILLLDEPLSSVEGMLREDLARLILSLKDEKRSIILVTHQVEEAMALADYWVLLCQGTVLQQGTTEEVFQESHNQKAAELLGYRIFVPMQNHQGCVVFPWESGFSRQSDSTRLAALMSDDLIVEPDPNGAGEVQVCRPWGRKHRLTLQIDSFRFDTVSNRTFSPGERVVMRLVRLPALVKEDK